VRQRVSPGYSLLELLVVIAIMSLMLGLLGGTLSTVRKSARSFECKNKLKTVAFEFFQFADDFSSSYRRSRPPGEPAGFDIDSFQEKLYGVDEFWGSQPSTLRRYEPSRQMLMCPAGPRVLERRADLPCEGYPVTPVENVTVAFNMRLRSASVMVQNRPVLKPVRLNSRILRHPSVPLAFDVDGELAARRETLPYYSAPPAGDTGHYASGLFWFPSSRHGSVNAAFVGGHVMSSKRPEKAPGWDWKYQPPPG
jgi:prepilin-type N-terminal cleavage/methylation domain-containing protein/prepilin-type processing-associated H-X9-DG protein